MFVTTSYPGFKEPGYTRLMFVITSTEWVLYITVNFKTRLANYKSHVKHNKRTCIVLLITSLIVTVLITHALLKFMLIDRRLDKLRECENFWIGV